MGRLMRLPSDLPCAGASKAITSQLCLMSPLIYRSKLMQVDSKPWHMRIFFGAPWFHRNPFTSLWSSTKLSFSAFSNIGGCFFFYFEYGVQKISKVFFAAFFLDRTAMIFSFALI